MELLISVSANTYGPLPDKLKEALSHLCKTYYPKIPMDNIWAACEEARMSLLDEDGEPWEGFLTGRDGRATIDLGDKRDNKVCNALHLQWHKMPSGKYEINAYLDK
jgi:hypothetical protein